MRFHLAVHGVQDARAAPVLLLPDVGRTWWSWRHLLPTLSPDRTVVALDPRGVGASDRTPGGYTLPEVVADLAAVVHHLGAGPAVVVGHGWGGVAALALASRHPALVAGLGLVAAPVPGAWQGYRRLLAASLLGARALTPARLGRWTALQAVDGSPCAEALSHWPGPQRALAPVRRAARRPRLLRELGTDVATLHVRGSSDPLLPRPRRGLRDVVVLPAGHQLPEERPGDLAVTLRGWLATLA
ncbi:alpha/beta fold hydrolase [Auraticoccus monumenti]|nr:alpha/beta hydrolase [Auraticoccus monumenti]